jgi:hypothetical protein
LMHAHSHYRAQSRHQCSSDDWSADKSWFRRSCHFSKPRGDYIRLHHIFLRRWWEPDIDEVQNISSDYAH